MTDKQPYEFRIAADALNDISGIWDWTVQQFGREAALRYETLIDQAIGDLADDPYRFGTKPRRDLLSDLWQYHLVSSRDRVAFAQSVKVPRHFVMFRHLQPNVIEIVRILHDSRDLVRHLSKG